MEKVFEYKVHPKENIYLVLKIIAGVLGYLLIFYSFILVLNSPAPAAFIPLVFYGLVIALYIFIRYGIIIGYIKGNAVKITKKQFPDIYYIVIKQSKKLDLTTIPEVYLLQQGGALNAFAARFLGSNYIIIYSDIVEEAFEGNVEAVEFVIGHELGHIKRRHSAISLWLFPSLIIPFLNAAYSRACEFTCDNIGAALNPVGARQGLLLLAAGKKLWIKTDMEAFIEQEKTEYGFWFWLSEKLSTHPRLTKRLSRFRTADKKKPGTITISEAVVQEKITTDHSAFFPKN